MLILNSSLQNKNIDYGGREWMHEKAVGWKSGEAAFECQLPSDLVLTGQICPVRVALSLVVKIP